MGLGLDLVMTILVPTAAGWWAAGRWHAPLLLVLGALLGVAAAFWRLIRLLKDLS
jgi:hypothetical protein